MTEKASDKRVGGPPTANISDGVRDVTAPGSKYLAPVDNNSLSCSGGRRRFVGPRCLLGKVGHSIGVWRARCLQPDGYCWIPNVCWRYLARDRISWDRSRRRSGICGGGKKKLTRDQRLLDIFGPRPTSVGEVWLGTVLVQYIWSGSTSVEDVDAPAKVPGGILPCDYVGDQ